MKKAIYAAFAILFAALSYQIYKIDRERRVLADEMREITGDMEAFEGDNTALREKINYLSTPHNLEKELRSRFNYRFPGEKLIIVIPEGE